MHHKRTLDRQPFFLAAVLLLAPLGLGAKGCDRAVVGEEGECSDGPDHCEAGGSAGTGGGTAGTSAGSAGTTAGKGGSTGSTGGSSTGGSGTTTGGSAGTGTSGTAGTGAGGESSDGDTCGGLQGLGCDDGEYCHYPPGSLCGAADQTGVCRATPEACDGNYQPVCGC